MREGQAFENDTNFHNCCGKFIPNSWIKLILFDKSEARKGYGARSVKIFQDRNIAV